MISILDCDLFPIDGKRNPPDDQEIFYEVDRIFTLHRRGFVSTEEVVEAMTDMARSAMLYGYANGIAGRKSEK